VHECVELIGRTSGSGVPRASVVPEGGCHGRCHHRWRRGRHQEGPTEGLPVASSATVGAEIGTTEGALVAARGMGTQVGGTPTGAKGGTTLGNGMGSNEGAREASIGEGTAVGAREASIGGGTTTGAIDASIGEGTPMGAEWGTGEGTPRDAEGGFHWVPGWAPQGGWAQQTVEPR
jgi:hypothetical protein